MGIDVRSESDVPVVPEKTVTQLLQEINKDGKIDGRDKEQLDELQSKFEAEKGSIIQDTKDQMKSVLDESLQKGYTVYNERDYQVLGQMLKISTGQEPNLPPYETFQRYGNFTISQNEGQYNFYNRTSFNWGTIDIKTGQFTEKLSRDTRDKKGDNNELDLTSVIDSTTEGAEQKVLSLVTKAEKYAYDMQDQVNAGNFELAENLLEQSKDMLEYIDRTIALNDNNFSENTLDKIEGIRTMVYEGETKFNEQKEKLHFPLNNPVNITYEWVKNQLESNGVQNIEAPTKEEIQNILEANSGFTGSLKNNPVLVYAIQATISHQLNTNNIGNIDGIYGPKTEKAMKDFLGIKSIAGVNVANEISSKIA